MEVSLFMKGKESGLRTYRDIVVKKEQDPQYDAKWESDAHPFTIEFPEPDKPSSSVRSLEGPTHRESGWVCRTKTAPICHARCGNERYRHAVVCEKPTDDAMEIVCI